MKTEIWKFELELTDRQKVAMPKGAAILTAQVQFANICIWAIVNPQADKEDREFEIYGTGNPIEDAFKLNYIGTVQYGTFVWHVFETPIFAKNE